MREDGPQFEREAITLQCTYNGAEGLFFAEELDWLVFASHEGVTTFGGSVVAELRASWSDLDRMRADVRERQLVAISGRYQSHRLR